MQIPADGGRVTGPGPPRSRAGPVDGRRATGAGTAPIAEVPGRRRARGPGVGRRGGPVGIAEMNSR
ncbi:hypothetical protein GCM10009802_31630 [Streptomyces synnematoformans]|uniref:Uncharacterized protein n=1 Tax=Streptomyces synnematoformans TaxID=415721 RepID=A0ABN2YEF3_9ACTN